MKSRYTVGISVVVGLVFLLAGSGFCQEGKVSMEQWNKIIESKVAEKVGDNGLVNYEEGYIEAKGTGAVDPSKIRGTNARPMCLRAAKVDGYRNLLEVTKGVQIDSDTKVENFITESDTIRATVSGLVKGAAQVGEPTYLSDGTCEVIMRMPMKGTFTKTVIAQEIKDRKENDNPPPRVKALPADTTGSEVYTGLVIDARGIGARPAMSPKIVDEKGAEVYGSFVVNREYAVQQGMTGYARDLTAAQGNPRVTNNPITVKAVSVEGAGKADIKISNADADKLRKVKENLSFLQQCRVMVVLD